MRGTKLLNLNNFFKRWTFCYNTGSGQHERLFSIGPPTKSSTRIAIAESARHNHNPRKSLNPSSGLIHQNRLLSTTNNNAQNNEKTPVEESAQVLVLVEMINKNIRKIILNRPKKKNALNAVLFKAFEDAINEGSNDNDTNILVITGAGDYFSAGADTKEGFGNLQARQHFKYLTKALIDCRKPIVVIVNGPAIGIGVTLLGLVDVVYASDTAMFWTPFSELGICAEACSSYTFPRIMGYAKAGDLLMFGAKINAVQAETSGLVTQVFPPAKLEGEAWTRIKAMGELPIKSLIYSKDLVRGRERELLHQVNENEAVKLSELVKIKHNVEKSK